MKTPFMLVAVFWGIFTAMPANGAEIEWKKIDSVNSNNYSGIACADKLHCMAIANFQGQGAAVIRRTVNGGETWVNVYKDSFWVEGSTFHIPDLVWCIAYPTPLLCMVGADSGLVLRTTDGGMSWQRIEMGIAARFTLLRMFDAQYGVIVAREGYAYTTGDSGATWQSIALPPVEGDYGLWDVAYTPPQTWKWLVLSENGYQTFITTDNGGSWDAFAGPSDATAWFFHDNMNGIAVGGREDGSVVRNIVHRTEDGGRNWQIVYNEATEPYGILQTLDFADPVHGFSGCTSGKVLYTEDGGLSWQPEATGLPTGSVITGMAFPTADIAFCTSFYGDILRYDHNIVSVPSEPVQVSHALVFPNPVGDVLRIRIEQYETNARLGLYTCHGRLVADLTSEVQTLGIYGAATVEYSVHHLPSAIYFLRYQTQYGQRDIPVFISR